MIRLLILCYMCLLGSAYKSFILKPGGLKGFYMMGICKYIKENYDLSDWHYYGSSAGAWNSMYLCCNRGEEIIKEMKELNQFSYTDLYDLETTIKKRMLKKFSIDDFDLEKLHICVSNKRKIVPFMRKQVVNDFRDLDDVLECCIASSHLPFISNGRFFYNYRNVPSLDGGFFLNPNGKEIIPDFILTPEMWKNKNTDTMNRMNNMDIKGLLHEGYNDACRHNDELDGYFNL